MSPPTTPSAARLVLGAVLSVLAPVERKPAREGEPGARRESGAIMITGLFMACFLIGALWFVVGIGDTLVFRTKMQEAADHGAFASAALHAKGMNFITLCNLVLLVAVAIHIILGIIHDIALVICIVSIGYACGFWVAMRKIYTSYFDILKPVAKVVHVVEIVASYGYPVMGLVEGMQTGGKYQSGKKELTVLALSPSLVPGGALRAVGLSTMKKEGLPVESRPMSFLCKKLAYISVDSFIETAGKITGTKPKGKILDMLKEIIGGVTELRYCNDLGNSSGRAQQRGLGDFMKQGNKRIDEENDRIKARNRRSRGPDQPLEEKVQFGGGGGGEKKDGEKDSESSSSSIDPGFDSFWGEDGPLVVFGAGSNGNEWFQTYAINFSPEMEDTSESHVGIARNAKEGVAKYTATERPLGYFAQSEFYFDCEERWSSPGCNYEMNAMFQIKWRARLRRLDIPNLGKMLGGMGFEMLTNIPKYQEFKKLQGGFGTMARKIFGNNTFGMTVVRSLLDYFTKSLETQLRDKINEAVKPLSPLMIGVYH